LIEKSIGIIGEERGVMLELKLLHTIRFASNTSSKLLKTSIRLSNH